MIQISANIKANKITLSNHYLPWRMLRVLQLGDNDYLSISSSGWSSGPTVPRDPTVGSSSIQHRNMRPVIDVTSLQVLIFPLFLYYLVCPYVTNWYGKMNFMALWFVSHLIFTKNCNIYFLQDYLWTPKFTFDLPGHLWPQRLIEK